MGGVGGRRAALVLGPWAGHSGRMPETLEPDSHGHQGGVVHPRRFSVAVVLGGVYGQRLAQVGRVSGDRIRAAPGAARKVFVGAGVPGPRWHMLAIQATGSLAMGTLRRRARRSPAMCWVCELCPFAWAP